MPADREFDAVLLIGFGGPTRAEEIRPFLDNVTRGRAVPPSRYEKVVHHYELLGGRSPYNEITMRQANALCAKLADGGNPLPVLVGMRNWHPYVEDTMRALAFQGARRVFGFVLAAHRSQASWEQYQETVRDAQQKIGTSAPEVIYPAPWHAHPLFVRANTDRVREALDKLDEKQRAAVHLLFTAHSIPVAISAKSRYVDEVIESSQLAASQLKIDSWSLAFQSRSGNPRDPWLEPDIGDALRKLAGRTVIVMPIGFLCDHVEVLYDLDIEAAQAAREAGVRMVRAQTVGDHPDFIAMIAGMAGGHLHR
ncbi:MAG TPA: ferrochelatase [Candidatus Binataceae bacterium]